MNRFQSLRSSIVLLVMGIMSISSFVSAALLFLFRVFGYVQWMPLFLTIIMLEVSMLIGTALALFVAKRFLRPINGLIDANKKVAQGDFSVRVEEDPDRTGEMHELLHSFNMMVAELQGIELYRSDFINNFSHEFKTPIISIRGFAKQLKNPELSKELQNEYLDIIISESEKLCNMSTNVLQMSKLDSQTLVGGKTRFSLDEQIRNSILLLERQWSEKNVNWELKLPSVEFYGNADLLSQVWKNLIENAIKFIDVGGTVGITIECADEFLLVHIVDNGCGMSEDTLAHIFEKFYQGDTSHAQQGNGLGLSIVKRISELCGGTVSVTSTEGKGSHFIVKLPLQKI